MRALLAIAGLGSVAALEATKTTLVSRAQVPWGQCGGIGYSGETTCQSGWTCVFVNDWYSQCQQSTGSAATTTTAGTPTTTSSSSGRVPTIYLCGDSTMANSGGNIEGWGEFLQYSFQTSKAVVINRAIGGRSARSFTREGRFDSVANEVQSGDWVVIEFGHNDGGSLSSDNGRTDCFGAGEETCTTVYNGVTEIVHTFPWYLKEASKLMLNKGAKVILSVATPNNMWETGTFGTYTGGRFFYYTWLAAYELGGPAAGVYFNPHGKYAAQAMYNLGSSVVNAGYPNDHTHTSPYMADVMSKAFVLGLKCGTSLLGELAVNSTSSLTSTFLGSCVSGYNSTVSGLLR